MTCPPKAAETARTVLEATPVDASDGWWTGLVRDRVEETGETRLRLERWVDNYGSYQNPHTWRVRPDFWAAERDAVATFQKNGGQSPPGNLPIDQFLTPLEYARIRKDGTRWVAVVRLEGPKGERVRLYHWDPVDESVRQKWTIGRDWEQLEALATRHLKPVA